MEESILYNGATLANSELLARLRNNPRDGIKPYQLPPDEFLAHIEAAIDAARVPWERGRHHTGDVDEPDIDLYEPVPQRRQRKRSLAKVCEAARRAGANHVIVDGVVIAFSSVAAEPESTANEWDAVLPEVDHGPH